MSLEKFFGPYSIFKNFDWFVFYFHFFFFSRHFSGFLKDWYLLKNGNFWKKRSQKLSRMGNWGVILMFQWINWFFWMNWLNFWMDFIDFMGDFPLLLKFPKNAQKNKCALGDFRWDRGLRDWSPFSSPKLKLRAHFCLKCKLFFFSFFSHASRALVWVLKGFRIKLAVISLLPYKVKLVAYWIFFWVSV